MKIKSIIIAILLLTASTCNAGFFDWLGFGDNVGGGMGTLNQLDQWRSTTNGITPNSSGKTIYAPLSDAYFADLTVGGIATTTTLCFDDGTCMTTVGNQTPWLSNIDGGGFNLTNVGYIEADTGTSTISNLNVTGDLTVGANIYGSFTFVTSGELTVDNINLSGNTISATDNGGIHIYDNASNGIFVKDGGNIGIGTTAPTSLLEVSGTGQQAIKVTDTTSSITTGVWAGTDQGSIGTLTNTDLRFVTNGDSKMTVTSGGNIGIGTTAPVDLLELAFDSGNDSIVFSHPSTDNMELNL